MNMLRSKEATLAVLVIALFAQVPHAAYVFTHIGKQQESWFSFFHGASYAVALELAVLLFVVRNRKLESYGFAGVSILINLSYYDMHGVYAFGLEAFPAWLVSIALPVAIACYSHDIAHEDIAPATATIDSTVAPPVVAVAQQEIEVVQSKPTAAQRRAQLAAWVAGNVAVHVATVAQQFSVSPQLVRKELKELRIAREEL